MTDYSCLYGSTHEDPKENRGEAYASPLHGFIDRPHISPQVAPQFEGGIKKSDSLVEQHTHAEMSRIYDDYEAKTLEAKSQLGERAVVIFEVGSFCQIMSIEDGLVDIHRLAGILKALVTRRDKKNPVVSRDNFLMIGWPTAYHDKMMERLRAHDYHARSAACHG